MFRNVLIGFVWVAWSAGVCRADTVSFPIVSDGRAVVDVVVAGDNKSLIAAVEDFKHYVHEISGVAINVVQGTKDTHGPTLHLGETELYAQTAGRDHPHVGR